MIQHSVLLEFAKLLCLPKMHHVEVVSQITISYVHYSHYFRNAHYKIFTIYTFYNVVLKIIFIAIIRYYWIYSVFLK